MQAMATGSLITSRISQSSKLIDFVPSSVQKARSPRDDDVNVESESDFGESERAAHQLRSSEKLSFRRIFGTPSLRRTGSMTGEPLSEPLSGGVPSRPALEASNRVRKRKRSRAALSLVLDESLETSKTPASVPSRFASSFCVT